MSYIYNISLPPTHYAKNNYATIGPHPPTITFGMAIGAAPPHPPLILCLRVLPFICFL